MAAHRGVALGRSVLVADDLAAGALVQPFGPSLAGRRYHLVHPATADRAAVAAVRDWLAAGLETASLPDKRT